jgi:hypothetical protein
MSIRLAIIVLAGIWLGFAAGAARALNIVSLTPITQEVSLGETVLVSVEIQFDDPTLGGGIDLLFDESVLEFVSFAFDPGLGDDPAFRLTPTTPAGGNQLTFLAISLISSRQSIEMYHSSTSRNTSGSPVRQQCG